MSFGQFAFQTAVFNALNNDSNLTETLGATIVDDVPHGTAFPFITMGDARSSEYDTKTDVGGDITLELHFWSQYKGSKEVKQMMDRCHSLLHNSSLSVTGFNLINLRFEFSDIMRDPDGITRHGVMRYRAIILGTS